MPAWLRKYVSSVSPTALDPHANDCFLNSKAVRPLANSEPHASKNHKHVVSAICGLLCFRCPPTIFFAVVAFHINSVKRHAGMALAHVLQKGLVGKPSVAHRNSAPAVVFVSSGRCDMATSDHAFPRSVRFSATARVGDQASLVNLGLKASARLGFSSQIACCDNVASATRTIATPKNLTMLVSACDISRSQSAKNTARKVLRHEHDFHNRSAFSVSNIGDLT